MLEDYLLQVRKPARYIGSEWNVSKIDFERSSVKFALCFPDLYEIGMSNLGIRIIYGLLNGYEGVACERFFSPAEDMEGVLRENNLSLFSLESRKRLRDFDFAGFSLAYELCYTNVLNILDLSGIPLHAEQRDASFPLIIAGGPSVLNPEPMQSFFDFFVIGEAEEAIPEIIELYKKHREEFKSGKITKAMMLALFAAIEGVYVPSLYEAKYTDTGQLKEFLPKSSSFPEKIRKRFVKDIDKSFFPVEWIVPYIEIVHDRITMEIMRGCPNRCRFCQARQQYFPLRVKKAETVLSLSCEAYKNSGYEEISLAGLSVSDYPYIEELLTNLIRQFQGDYVSISLPSVKPKAYLGNMASLIATIKKTGLTFAPEAATERLRGILNKDFDLESFFRALEHCFEEGYQRVKLYFMIGIPGEKEEDLDAIIDFALRVSRLRRSEKRGPAFVNVSINTMIPKPHTPFQWLGMEGIEAMKTKSNYLRSRLKDKKVSLNFHDPYMSFLEAVLSRGDRRVGSVIEKAYKLGARFDAWQDHFVFAKWLEAFTETGLDPQSYLREKSTDEALPWDFLDTGVDNKSLREEYRKAFSAEL